MSETKACGNCEGEGKVTRWGLYGHEVPASRAIHFPNDPPREAAPGDGEPLTCGVCEGRGGYDYAETFPNPLGEPRP